MVVLKKVDSRNVWKLLKLDVREDQNDFVATNTQSIVEAFTTISAGGVAIPFGIYDGDVPVGFLMIGYDDIPGEENPSVAKGNYCIWRLMIDKEQQGRGYGRQALMLALEYIRSFPCGPAELCWLSYEPENLVAESLYKSLGFTPTGDYDEDEPIAVLTL